MPLSGGLIQLISKNDEDAQLTNNPEIFPFLKIYKKNTNFSIDDNCKNLGDFKRGNKISYTLNNIGDLLGNINLVLTLAKKYKKNNTVSTTGKITFTDFLTIKLNNTEYYVVKEQDLIKSFIILIPKNINIAFDNNYVKSLYNFNLEIDHKILLNKLLSYNEVFIKVNSDNILNEINKYNNVREKFYIYLINNLKDKKVSVLGEFFDIYYSKLNKLFISNYDNNQNLENKLFNLDNNLALNFYNNNFSENILQYDSIVILDNIMSSLRYNNQRFTVTFHYEYNKEINIFSLTNNDILEILEWSNNLNINLNELINKDVENNLLQYFINNYNEKELFLKARYRMMDFKNKLTLINLLNYRDIINNNFIKKDNNDTLSLNIYLIDNFEIDYVETYFKKGLLSLKVNLVYHLLDKFNFILNEISKDLTNTIPLKLFKRILCNYIFIRDQVLENSNYRNINNYNFSKLQIDADSIGIENIINSFFYVSIDRMYPLKKDFFYNELHKIKFNKNIIINHNNINTDSLVRECTKTISIYNSDIDSFKYMIKKEDIVEFKFISKYSFKINGLSIISYVKDQNIYFITTTELDIIKQHELTIISNIDFLNINSILSYNFDTTNSLTTNKEFISKDINIFRNFNLKNNKINYFITDNKFKFEYKRPALSTSNTIQTNDINIFDFFEVVLHCIDFNNIETRLKINKDNVVKESSNYTISGFIMTKYKIINLIIIMKPTITIDIDTDTNIGLNDNYEFTDIFTFINSQDIQLKLVNYLLLYYNFNEIEKMKDNYETLCSFNSDTFVNQYYDITSSNYIDKLKEYINLKYLSVNYRKFLIIKNSSGFLDNMFSYSGNNYYVISGSFNQIEITNSYYYDNLLKITSESTLITNSYFTDFLTYHPMIIKLNENNSILLNITDYEQFDKNYIDSKEIIIIDEIQSNMLFKEVDFSSKISKNISTIIDSDINITTYLDDIYQDEILNMINTAEVNTDLIYLKNFLDILQNLDDDHNKKILGYLLENNINNSLFTFNSDQYETSIYKFYEGSYNGEVTNIIDTYKLMEIIKTIMPNNFFNYRRLHTDDFMNMKKLGIYLSDKLDYIKNNQSKLEILNKSNYNNKLINYQDNFNHLLDFVGGNEKEYSFLHLLIFKDEYILKIQNKNEMQTYSSEFKYNVISDQKVFYCKIKNGLITNYDNTLHNLSENQLILNDDNIIQKEGNVLNPKIVSTEVIASNLKNKSGFFYIIKVDSIPTVSGGSIVGKYCLIHNGEKYYYGFVVKTESSSNEIYIVSKSQFYIYQIINFYSLGGSTISLLDSLELDGWDESILASYNFIKLSAELSRIYEFKNIYRPTTLENVLENILLEYESNNYYFCKQTSPKKYTVLEENGPNILVNDNKFYIPKVYLENDKVYQVYQRDIFIDNKTAYILDEVGEKLNSNVILISINVIKFEINLITGSTILIQTNLNSIDNILYRNNENTIIDKLNNNTVLDLSKTYTFWKIINNKVKIYNHKYKLTLPKNYILSNNYNFNNGLYNIFNDGIIQQSKYITLFYKHLTRTIQISDSYNYNTQVYNGSSFVNTSIINFSIISESKKIKIEKKNDSTFFNFIGDFRLNSSFLDYTINSNTNELILTLKETIQPNQEYVAIIYIENEEILINIYYDSIPLYLNLHDESLFLGTSTTENLNRSLTFDNIKNSMSNFPTNGDLVTVYNYPLLGDNIYINENFKFINYTDPDQSINITQPLEKIINGQFIYNPGYLILENNNIYIYTQNYLVEGMSIKINDLSFIVEKVFGKISLVKTESNVSKNIIFDGFIYFGLNRIVNYDNELSSFTIDNINNNVLSHVSHKFKNDLYSFISNGIYNKDYSLSYKILNITVESNKMVITLEQLIKNLRENDKVLILDKDCIILSTSKIVKTIIEGTTYYTVDNYPTAKFIIVNGNKVKYGQLNINNNSIDRLSYNIKINDLKSIMIGIFISDTNNFLINKIILNTDELYLDDNYIKNPKIFELMIKNYNEEIIFLANNKIKITITVNLDSLKSNLQLFYTNNTYLFKIIESVSTLTDYLNNSNINKLITDLLKIVEKVDLKLFDVKLNIDYKYVNNTLNFIKEISSNKILIHLIKIRNNIITSNFKLKDEENLLLYNNIFNIKIVNNKIINLKNDYKIEDKRNISNFCQIIYKIPVIIIDDDFTNGIHSYTIQISNEVFNSNVVNPNISNNYIYLDSGLTNKIELSKLDGLYDKYTIILENNYHFNFIYLSINNQISTVKISNENNFIIDNLENKISNENNFIIDNLKNKIYYTNNINQISRKLISTYKTNKKYSNLFNVDLPTSFILINNEIITVNNDFSDVNTINIETELDFENLLDNSSYNLFYDSGDYELPKIDVNDTFLSPSVFYSSLESNLDIKKFMINKDVLYSLKNPFEKNLVSYNNYLFTKSQYTSIIDINFDKYTIFRNMAIIIINQLLDNPYLFLINANKGFNNNEDLDKYINVLLLRNMSNNSNNFSYTQENGLFIDGFDYDFNNIYLSIKVFNNLLVNSITDNMLTFTFKEFISKLHEYLNLFKSTIKEINIYSKNKSVSNFEYEKFIKNMLYSKYCIEKKYNRLYLENFDDNIYKYNLDLGLIDENYELIINDNIIKYEYFDNKHIILYYNQPNIFIDTLELKKEYNIINSTNLGKLFNLSVKRIIGSTYVDFNLLSKMNLSTILDNQFIEINVIKDNVIYSNFDITNITIINLIQKIYIYEKVKVDDNIVYKFNINNNILDKNDIYIILENINYNVTVDFNNNTISVPTNNTVIIAKILNNNYYTLTNYLQITSINSTEENLLEIEIEKEININLENETFYLENNIKLTYIKQILLNKFRIISQIETPSKLIKDKVEKVNDSIEYNSLTLQNDKVMIINHTSNYITEDSLIIINDTTHQIFKIDDNFVFRTNLTSNGYILNSYSLYKNSDGYYFNNDIVLDFINEEIDYTLTYYYINNSEIVYIDNSKLYGNKLILDNIISDTVILYQKITYVDNIFLPYQYHHIVVLDVTSIPDINVENNGLIHLENKGINIYRVPLSISVIINIKETIIINNESFEVIPIKKNNQVIYIKTSYFEEIENYTYIYTNENLDNTTLLDNTLLQIKIKGKFIIHSFNSNNLTIFVNSNIFLSQLNYLFITKSYINIKNELYGNSKLVYFNKEEIIESTVSTLEIIPNKFQIFKNLKLFINNEIIDSLDPDIFQVIYNYHFNDMQKIQFDKITRLRDIGDSYKLTLPLMFYFYNKPHLYIPLVALTNSEIRLEGIVNYDCKIKSVNQFILLDTMERYKFGSYGHEYLIEKYNNYDTIYLNKTVNINKFYIKGIIKNIYIKTIDDQDNNIEIKKELIYNNIYNKYLKDKNKITTQFKRIIDEIELYLDDDSNELFVLIKTVYELLKSKKSLENIISYELILYILYEGTPYLINKNKLNHYLYRTILILINLKVKENLIKKPYLTTLNFKCNGDSLFNKQDELYFNSVTPYKKLNSSLPDGYYYMTFSLQPEENNPSGHLNFNLFEETVLITTCNDNINNRIVKLNLIVKEYNILRVLGGMGTLAWQHI